MSAQGGYSKRFYEGEAVSSTNTYYSDRWSMLKGSIMSIHLIAEQTSALVGTWTLCQSNKPNADPSSDTDWEQNTDVTFTAVSGDTSQFLNIGNAGARWYRLKYVNTSGTGTIDAYILAGKGA